MHRIGGIEKEDGSGNISYDPDNHERMVAPAGRQGRRHRQRHPAARGRRRRRRRRDPRRSAGARRGAPSTAPSTGAARRGRKVAQAHLVHLNPFPPNLGEVLRRYPKVLVPEMNLGQLSPAAAGRVPGRRPVGHQGPGRAVHRRRARAGDPGGAGLDDRHRRSRSPPARTGRATRRCAGAPAAATTRSSPPCSCSCPSSACAARTRCSSPASAAPPASRTT